MQELNINSNKFRIFGILFIFLLILAFILSCKKKEFPVNNQIPNENELLYFKGKINNEYTEIILNNSNYQNDIYFGKDSMNVCEYKSTLLPVTASGGWEIGFTLRDNQVSSSMTGGYFEQWMKPGISVGFIDKSQLLIQDTQYVVGFKGWGNVQNINYSYMFGDGGISYASQATHTYDHCGTYDVKFFVYEPTSQIQSVIQNKVDLPRLKNNFYYYIKLDSVNSYQYLAYFSAQSIFTNLSPNTQFLWNLGQGFVPLGKYLTLSYIPGTLKIITMKAIYGTDTTVCNYQFAINLSQTPPLITSNFHINSFMENVTQGINLFLKQVAFTVKSPDGKLYSSQMAGNSNSNYNLSIQDIQSITSPAEGHLAKKVRFTVNANLVNTINTLDTLKIRDAEARLIFIYKNARR